MKSTEDLTDRLLSTKEAAPILGTTPDAFKISRCTGLLFGVPAPKYLKIGYTVRYKRSTLQAWLEQFEEQSCGR